MANAFVAHSGGPTAVLNASLWGIVEEARRKKIKHLWAGCAGLGGMKGVKILDLLAAPARMMARAAAGQPGSVIGSYRGVITDEDLERFIRFCQKQDIRYCFYSGGNGSMGTALRIAETARNLGYELVTVGVPKTMDNDLCGTDHSPGFGSAARFVVSAVRDIGLDQKALPSPVSIIEVMGRNTGWLAAASLLARYRRDAPPHFIYVPEQVFDPEEFLGRVDGRLQKLGWAVGVVGEGLKDASGHMIGASGGASRDARGRVLAGNCSVSLAALVTRRLKVRARSEKPGILCRAFSLCRSPIDAAEAYAAGQFAVRAALSGQSSVMVALRRVDSRRYHCAYTLVPLTLVAHRERKLEPMYLRSGAIHERYIQYVSPLVGEPFDAPVLF